MKTSKIFEDAFTLKKTKVIVFGILLAISIILPAFIHIQWITGPIVNASLILSVETA